MPVDPVLILVRSTALFIVKLADNFVVRVESCTICESHSHVGSASSLLILVSLLVVSPTQKSIGQLPLLSRMGWSSAA